MNKLTHDSISIEPERLQRITWLGNQLTLKNIPLPVFEA
jgi:hypothetical protein